VSLALQRHPEVRNLLSVTAAFSPVVKFTLRGIDFDVVYACTGWDYLPQVPQEIMLRSSNILSSMEAFSVRAVNGRRVNDVILDVVNPSPPPPALRAHYIEVAMQEGVSPRPSSVPLPSVKSLAIVWDAVNNKVICLGSTIFLPPPTYPNFCARISTRILSCK